MINRLEGYTGNGFQERRAYINLHNDINFQNNKKKMKLNVNKPSNIDSKSNIDKKDNSLESKLDKPIFTNNNINCLPENRLKENTVNNVPIIQMNNLKRFK